MHQSRDGWMIEAPVNVDPRRVRQFGPPTTSSIWPAMAVAVHKGRTLQLRRQALSPSGIGTLTTEFKKQASLTARCGVAFQQGLTNVYEIPTTDRASWKWRAK